MTHIIPTQEEKCKGAMLATAIGDALGWPNEPRSKNKVKNKNTADGFVAWTRTVSTPRWHDEKILPGEYSDDTQLTLAVARSIIAGDWEHFFAQKELPFWLSYERGGGGALLRAAQSCKKGILLWQSSYTKEYFNAGGNGAVMRILPHVIASAKTRNITELMTAVIKDTLITHGHPRAFLGATCYAYALDYLLRKDSVLEYGELISTVINGKNVWGTFPDRDIFEDWLKCAANQKEYDFSKTWEDTLAQMLKQLEFISDSLKKGLMVDDKKILTELECFGSVGGAGNVAALAALYLASRYANNPILGIKTPAFLFGIDTDTIASITGGLLGMLSGADWIPAEWRCVQDYDCLVQMTELLLADNKREAAKKAAAESRTQDEQWYSTLIGKMQCVKSKNVPNGPKGTIIIDTWRTVWGQTLYRKTFQPRETQPTNSITAANQKNINPAQSTRALVLNLQDISDLLEEPKFKANITVGKILKIARSLMEEKSSKKTIAKKFGVEESVVELLDKYILG